MSAHILVIDDYDACRRLMREALETAGYQVVEASNGGHGLKLYLATPTDLIITDILMPDKEGIETILEIRRHDRDVPILAMSGGGSLSSSRLLDIARKFGADAAIAKPFAMAELLALVDRLLASKATAKP